MRSSIHSVAARALVTIVGLVAGAPHASARDFEKDALALQQLYATLAPSVVSVRVAVRRDSTSTTEIDVEAEAAGIVVDEHGLVIVPAMLADGDGAAAPRVTAVEVFATGGARFEARWLGKARDASIAFVKIDDAAFKGAPARFADDDSIHVGDFVASLRLSGPNFRRLPFIDAFMVSAMLDDPRCGLTSFAAADYLGSCVATLDGRVVGVMGWMSLAPSHGGRDSATGAQARSIFGAIHGEDPTGSEIVIVPGSIVRDAIARGPEPDAPRQRAPFLGLEVQALPREVASWYHLEPNQSAARVSRVLQDTPAAAAGFVIGDLVVAVGDQPLTLARAGDTSELSNRVQDKEPGQQLSFDVLRGTAKLTLSATLGEAPLQIDEAPRATCDAFGVHARDLVFGDRAECGLAQSQAGARMTAVSFSGHMGQAGLLVGDLVLKLDDRDVASAAELCDALTAAAEAKATDVALFVQRGRRTLFVHAHPEWEREEAR